MRLKSFSAPSMTQALRMVRDELGQEAVIVSTVQSKKSGVRVTAAVEQDDAPQAADARAGAPAAVSEIVRCALEEHGVPQPIVDRLAAATGAHEGSAPPLALAAALDACFRFDPVAEAGPGRRIMLVGPPGVGKTVTVAKLAARAVMRGRAVAVLSTDTARAGGVAQLEGFTRLMNVELRAVADAKELGAAIGDCAVDDLVLIDSAGTNPYSDPELEALGSLIRAARAEPVLVLAAGGDAVEQAETGAAFAALGASRLLATRLDMARRLGALLAAADAGNLRFSNASTTPFVGRGLAPINPVSLARLLLPGAAPADPQPAETEQMP